MQICAKTDRGKLRDLNEDSFAVKESPPYSLLIVADGMGGHNAGEVASQMAVERLEADLSELVQEGRSIPELMEQAMSRANHEIYLRSGENPEYAAMGTTAVVCCTTEQEAYFANVGDSRAYLISPTATEQITEDHSLVMELLRRGEITEEEAMYHPQRNVITRALGTERTVQTDLFQCDLEEDDILLLCSDGLTGMLSDEEIAAVMREELPLEERVDRLIAQANERGGYDNITIIAATRKEG